MLYALIKNSKVINIIDADQSFADTLTGDFDAVIQTDAATIGDDYIDGIFAAQTPAPQPPWTKKEFLLRFTPVEYSAIKAACASSAEIDYYWTLFTVAEAVDKSDPATVAGIAALESAGLIAAGRTLEILA